MSSYTTPNIVLNNNLTANNTFPNVAWQNSWIQVDNTGARPLFAQASYITNLDNLVVSLTASNVNIGDIHITDPTTGLHANVVNVGTGLGALRVISQDLDSIHDTVSLGDKSGNNVSLNSLTSALFVEVKNTSPISVSGNVTVSNLISSVSAYVINPVTSLSAFITNPQIEITNDIGNAIPTTITNTITAVIPPTQTVPVQFADVGHMDAFGRLRVSQPTTLLDTKFLYQKNSFVFDEVLNGSATSTLSAADAAIDLRTSANGDYAIRQTRVRYNYQPGKSIQYMFTGLFKPETNITKRVGAFQSGTTDPYTPTDGMYLEVTGAGPSFNIVKTQGTPYTMTAPRSAWNVDKLDGTGASGVTIDFNQAVLFSMDYEWLGVGRVRFGFYANGRFNVAHVDNHTQGLSGAYISSPNQPVRYEIRQTGNGSGLLRQICSTVMVDGATENTGKIYAVENGQVTVPINSYAPVLALQLNPQTQNVVSLIKQVDLINTGGFPASFGVFINPTITGGSLSFSPVATNNSMLSASGNGLLTITEGVSGYKIMGGYLASSNGSSSIGLSQNTFSNEARFGYGIRGDSDIIVVAVKSLGPNSGNTTTIYGTLGVLEKS